MWRTIGKSLVVLALSWSVWCDLLDDYVRHVGQVNNRFAAAASTRAKRVKRHDAHSGGNWVHHNGGGSGDIEWTHSEVLDFSGFVVLRWQPRHQEILFRLEARTRGYVGLGFSPDGSMEGADIVIGYVEDRSGRAHLMDCHGVPKKDGSAPVRDEKDNYTLIRGMQNDTHTVLEFRRALDTCDPDDYVLNADTVRIIWALHDRDPDWPSEMVYHGDKRGVQSVHLLEPPPLPNSVENHVRNWDVTLNNVEVKQDMKTIYWCKIFRSPTLQQKHHIVGYEPLIGLNHSNCVHHMLLHECAHVDADEANVWETYSRDEGRACYSQEMPPDWERCTTTLVAWAVGSKGETYPPHVGLPLAEKRTNSYYMLEVHFDNPTMRRAVDTTGLRLRYTHKLRQHDAGVLVTGVALSSLHFVPPNQSEYRSAGYCSFDCTSKELPPDGINVVSVLLHSHLAGRKLKLRHVRGRRELRPVAQDNRYDFSFQQTRRLSQEVTILPGDGLVTECTYSTLGRRKPTLGGYSTHEEMCLAFVLHYPRAELAGCFSMPPVKYFFENLGVREFYNKSMNEIERIFLEGTNEVMAPPTTRAPLFRYRPGDEHSPEANEKARKALLGAKEFTIDGDASGGGGGQTLLDKLVIKEPLEFRNKTFMAHLEHIPYDEPVLTQKIEEYFYKGLHLTFCKKRNDSLTIREKVEKFPEFVVYQPNNSMQCSYRSSRFSSGNALKPRFNYLLLFLVVFLQ